MSLPFDLSALHRVLAETLKDAAPARDRLEPLSPNGLDNDHVRLGDTGTVARVPRWPVDDLKPDAALALRAERFCRAASAHVPALHAVLPPADGLPNGALVVDEIRGVSARVPDDMDAIADALASLHAPEMPAPAARPPLPDASEPAAALIDQVARQSETLRAAGADRSVQRLVAAEIEQAGRLYTDRWRLNPQPQCLVGTDTHPGNFLVAATGRAVLVDLDKAMYGSPAVDLAHASVPSSVFWATGDWDRLGVTERRRFYERYLNALATERTRALEPWLAPMARLTWLRTTTWAARWRVRWLPVLRKTPGLEALVERADSRTAALLDAENVKRQAAALPAWDAEDPA